jgi:hypothetical protein
MKVILEFDMLDAEEIKASHRARHADDLFKLIDEYFRWLKTKTTESEAYFDALQELSSLLASEGINLDKLL